MLFADEAPLREADRRRLHVHEDFPAARPARSRGRSLRDFDLQTRLFRYPLSYMIYSPAFDALPQPVRDRIYRRLFDVLSGKADYVHLAKETRRAILEIVRETKSRLPEYWRSLED